MQCYGGANVRVHGRFMRESSYWRRRFIVTRWPLRSRGEGTCMHSEQTETDETDATAGLPADCRPVTRYLMGDGNDHTDAGGKKCSRQ